MSQVVCYKLVANETGYTMLGIFEATILSARYELDKGNKLDLPAKPQYCIPDVVAWL